MASFTFNEGAHKLQTGAVSFTADTIKAALIAESQTPDKDDTDLTAAKYTGANRIGTDQTLGAKSVNKNTTDDRVEYLQSAMLTWSSVTGAQVGWIVIYEDDTVDIPLFALDLSSPVTPNGGDLTWTPPSNVVGYTQQ